MLLSKLFLLATASLGACSILPTHLSNNTNTTTHLLDPRSNPGTHEGVFKGYDCEGPFGARCDLKRRKSEQGEIGKANSTQLNKCLIDLSRATDPKRPGLSKDQKNYSKSRKFFSSSPCIVCLNGITSRIEWDEMTDEVGK